MKKILSIDQGTTSTRCILFDEIGNVLASAQKEFTQYFPHPGWVEHDPDEILEGVKETYNLVLNQLGLKGNDIFTLGITNQRETTILWDRNSGKAVYPAIVWQSRQSLSICDRLQNLGLKESIRSKTGLELDAYFSASKIAWILENIEGIRTKAESGELAFGTIDTWLLWNLTGGKVHATDYSNASRTLLFNIYDLCWDTELLNWFNIPSSILPEVKESSTYFGTTVSGFLDEGISINGIAGDQQAALFGQGCIHSTMAKNTYGTGCFMLMNTGGIPVNSNNGLITTIAWKIGGKVCYALEGSVFVAGSAIQWLRDGLGLISHVSETEGIASQVINSNGVYFVPAFVGLGAPHWNSEARGAFFGLTRGTNRAHIVRAALESIAYQTTDIFKVMQEDANMDISILFVDGGASSNNLLMQFQCDLLQVEVIRARYTETTALGAALLAGLSAGVWSSIQACSEVGKKGKSFIPENDRIITDVLYHGWKKAVEATINYKS
ncbi:MAG: glycerol kinase GlpK [Bacteroidota bacterium]